MKKMPQALFIIGAYVLTAFIITLSITQQKVSTDDFSVLRFVILLLFFPVMSKYFFQLLISPWYGLVSKYSKIKATGYNPKVSVLIPAWNEEVGIINTVQSILKSTYTNFEVIVINDGSTDGTHERMSEFLDSHPQTPTVVQYSEISNGGKANALNTALTLATGDIIVTIDADSIMDPNALSNFVKRFADPEVMSVAGNVIVGNRTSILGAIQQLEYLYGFYFKRGDSLLNSIYIVGGAAAAYRRTVFKKIGKFDREAITEDIEFSTRIQNAGCKIMYAPDAVVYTEGPSELSGLLKQRLRWKYGRLITFFKYRSLFWSTKKKHSKYLSLVVLPIALFAEILLLLEVFMLIVFYSYTFYYHDYFPLIINMIVLTVIISLQIATDPKSKNHRNLYALAPIAWCLFYFIDFIEFQSLVRSIYKLANRQKVVWQKWNRVGVFGV